MIRSGKSKDPDHVTLDALMASTHVFYMTGSRWLGTADRDSDYDFFATSSPELITWLVMLEFQEIDFSQSPYGLDPAIQRVFRKGRIDIQLVESAELRSEMQECLKESGLAMIPNNSRSYSKPDQKSIKALIWRAAWQLVEIGKKFQ